MNDARGTIIATSGHTPGHQSLLVKLPKTSVVLLSDDEVHCKQTWDNRSLPSINLMQRANQRLDTEDGGLGSGGTLTDRQLHVTMFP